MWTDSSIAKWHREADPQKGPRCSFLVLLSEIYKQAPEIGHPETVQENASRFLCPTSPRKSPGGLIQDFNSENKTEMAVLHVPHEQGGPRLSTRGQELGRFRNRRPTGGADLLSGYPLTMSLTPGRGKRRKQMDSSGHKRTTMDTNRQDSKGLKETRQEHLHTSGRYRTFNHVQSLT